VAVALSVERYTFVNADIDVTLARPFSFLRRPASWLKTITRLKEQGVAVVIISHRLEDIFAIGDSIMVMKQGRVVGERHVGDTEDAEIVEMIVTGRDPRAGRAA